SSSSLLIGRCTSSRQVKRWRSSGVPLMLVRSSATEQPPARFCAALFFSGEGAAACGPQWRRRGARDARPSYPSTSRGGLTPVRRSCLRRTVDPVSGTTLLHACLIPAGVLLVVPGRTGNPLGETDMANNQNQNNQNQQNQNKQNQNQQNQQNQNQQNEQQRQNERQERR